MEIFGQKGNGQNNVGQRRMRVERAEMSQTGIVSVGAGGREGS